MRRVSDTGDMSPIHVQLFVDMRHEDICEMFYSNSLSFGTSYKTAVKQKTASQDSLILARLKYFIHTL